MQSPLSHYCEISTMAEMQQAAATIIATNTVFERLGAEVADILKAYLARNYSICLEPDCLFAVEELAIALHRLVSEQEARSIMQEIRQEMADISSMQKLTTRKKGGTFSFWQVD
jgi:L-rhamnose mutarotase